MKKDKDKTMEIVRILLKTLTNVEFLKNKMTSRNNIMAVALYEVFVRASLTIEEREMYIMKGMHLTTTTEEKTVENEVMNSVKDSSQNNVLFNTENTPSLPRPVIVAL